MSDDKAQPSGNQVETTSLQGSGEFKYGVQVIGNAVLPEGFVPPSASLTPPPPAAPVPDSSTSQPGAEGS